VVPVHSGTHAGNAAQSVSTQSVEESQSSSSEFPHASVAGFTSPTQGPHFRSAPQAIDPGLHCPTPEVPAGPV